MKNISLRFVMLLLGVVACQPVFAIGWRELIFVIVIMALLLVPPAYRFLRKLENFRKQKDK
jgi:hypothetical protein